MNSRVLGIITVCTLFMAIGCTRNKPKKPEPWKPPGVPTGPAPSPLPVTPSEQVPQTGSQKPPEPTTQSDRDELRPRPRPKPTQPQIPMPNEKPPAKPGPDLTKNVWRQGNELLTDLIAQPGSVMISAPMTAPILNRNDAKTAEEQVMTAPGGSGEIRVRRSSGQKQDGSSIQLGMGSFSVLTPKTVSSSTVENVRADLQTSIAIGCDQTQLDQFRKLGYPEVTARVSDFASVPSEHLAPEPKASTTFSGVGSAGTVRIRAGQVFLCGQPAFPQLGVAIEAKSVVLANLRLQSQIGPEQIFSLTINTNRFYIIGENNVTTSPASPSSRPAFIGIIVSNEFAGNPHSRLYIELGGWSYQ